MTGQPLTSDRRCKIPRDEHLVFALHGYPWAVQRLTYRCTTRNLHMYGDQEEGTITTLFDIRVRNDRDRCRLTILNKAG
jgi:xylulose-5-phosphate/fructose-6-phosphate phosphoketolase